MSQRELEAVIGRAIVDEEFRTELFANLTTALAGYELTKAEVAALRLVDAESLDACGSICRQKRLNGLKIHVHVGRTPQPPEYADVVSGVKQL